MTLTELSTPIAQVHVGDVVIEHDWRLHVAGTGVDATGAYVTTTEFGADVHLHHVETPGTDVAAVTA